MTFDNLIAVAGALAAAIIGWMAVCRPLVDRVVRRRKERKAAIDAVLQGDKDYRANVLGKLSSMEAKIDVLDESFAEMQRDSIERSYCMFVIEHKYCPSGMKNSIQSMYDSYSARGYNHIARSRVEELLNLPEFPGRKDAYGNAQGI